MLNNISAEFKRYTDRRKSSWSKNFDFRARGLGSSYHKNLAEIYKHLIPPHSSILEIGCGTGDLLSSLSPSRGVGIDFSVESIQAGQENHPDLDLHIMDAHEISLASQNFDFIIVSDLINDLWDVQSLLLQLKPYCTNKTRVIFNFYNPLWSLPLTIARKLGLATPLLKQNWLTHHDMQNLLAISGYEELRHWQEILLPLPIPIFANLCNRYVSRIFPFSELDLTNYMVARLQPMPRKTKPTVSVVIAARNEAGHILELLERIPQMGGGTEIIFVEGNSTDDTFEVIKESIRDREDCKLIKQSGKGKGDAVRAGFNASTGDILMILDADITVPPEDLPRFYDLLFSGAAEFVNGVRLVYPMDSDAMRPLNFLGNKFFSWAFSWLLGQPIRDTLCGTKVLWKKDYERIADNRSYFGDFDPFGDFDLLFGAARLNLKILEIPIRYRARRYGETNISRWSHGWLLLKMVFFAAKRIKFV